MTSRLVLPRKRLWGVVAFSLSLAGCGAGQSGESGELPAPEVAVAVVESGELPILPTPTPVAYPDCRDGAFQVKRTFDGRLA